jgi:carbon starvation protein
MSNQLLASCALIIGTIMLMRMGKLKYSWMTAVPGIVMAITTLYAGYLNITTNYLPAGKYLLAVLSIIVMILVIIILFAAAKRCYDLLQMKNPVIDKYGDLVLEVVEE